MNSTLAAAAGAALLMLSTQTGAQTASPACPLETHKPDTSQLTTYQLVHEGRVRRFDHDGATPFVDAECTGQGYAATFQYNPVYGNNDKVGLKVLGYEISNNGVPGYIEKHEEDGEVVTKVTLKATDGWTAGENAYRTQINGYFVEPGKRYVLDLEFKLGATWKFKEDGTQEGLLWQLKGSPKSDQWGNPSLALVLKGDKLKLKITYPKHASDVPPGSRVYWDGTAAQYIDSPFETLLQTVKVNQYHRVQLVFFADDKPNSYSQVFPDAEVGKGFVSATFDGLPWGQARIPTLHPDQEQLHQVKWGWYQWTHKPTEDRTVYYRKNRLYEWK